MLNFSIRRQVFPCENLSPPPPLKSQIDSLRWKITWKLKTLRTEEFIHGNKVSPLFSGSDRLRGSWMRIRYQGNLVRSLNGKRREPRTRIFLDLMTYFPSPSTTNSPNIFNSEVQNDVNGSVEHQLDPLYVKRKNRNPSHFYFRIISHEFHDLNIFFSLLAIFVVS